MPRAQAAALSTSASCSASGGDEPSTDAGGDAVLRSAQAQPSTAVCTDESSGLHCEAQSRHAAHLPAQQPQPLLVQWLASTDAATRRHAAGVMAAVSGAALPNGCTRQAMHDSWQQECLPWARQLYRSGWSRVFGACAQPVGNCPPDPQVNMATAISLLCGNPALASLACRGPLHMPTAPTAAAVPCGDSSGPAPAAAAAPSLLPTHQGEAAIERRKRASGPEDEACQ